MKFSDGDSLIRWAISHVLGKGKSASPRGMEVIEITEPTVMTLTDVHRPFMMSRTRRPNYRFGLAEACWILSGSDDAKLISKFNKNMANYSDDGQVLWGAYGPRLVSQLPHVVGSLVRDPDSRQAVVTTWRPMSLSDCEHPGYGPPEWDGMSFRSKDVPCTVAWHFQLRDGKLDLTVFMRSNDIWLGLPYDLLSFTTVQRAVASMIDVLPGEYHHVVSNLHVYGPNVDLAKSVLRETMFEEIPVLEPLWSSFFLDGMGVADTVKTMSRAFGCILTGNGSMDGRLATFVAAVKNLKTDEDRCWNALRSLRSR